MFLIEYIHAFQVYKNYILSIVFLCTVLQCIKKQKCFSKGAKALNSKYDIDKVVGQSLARHRLACNMTQAQVAEALGISVDAISRMERGTISLNLPKLMQFAKLFKCKLSDFVIESSPLIDEQLQYLAKIMEPLDINQRNHLIKIIESMVIWYNGKDR